MAIGQASPTLKTANTIGDPIGQIETVREDVLHLCHCRRKSFLRFAPVLPTYRSLHSSHAPRLPSHQATCLLSLGNC